jgi:hypothetical protein
VNNRSPPPEQENLLIGQLAALENRLTDLRDRNLDTMEMGVDLVHP